MNRVFVCGSSVFSFRGKVHRPAEEGAGGNRLREAEGEAHLGGAGLRQGSAAFIPEVLRGEGEGAKVRTHGLQCVALAELVVQAA